MVHKCNISRLLEKREDQLDVHLLKYLCIQLSCALLNGIDFLYDNGILHCDLTPKNILFHRDDDHIYIGICDWRFACREDSPCIFDP